MHELSVCQALLEKVLQVADLHHAGRVDSISVQLGPLSGVDAALLEHAWPLASADSIAERAVLKIDRMPLKVRCQMCGKNSEVSINRLLCSHCGAWQTTLISGDEMLLRSVELAGIKETGEESYV